MVQEAWMAVIGFDWQKARSNFALTDNIIYLDHASQGPLPKPSRQAYDGYLNRWQRMDRRHGPDIFESIENVRKNLASLIGVASDRICISSTTSYGLNIISAGYPWVAGDNVVVSDGDFPANIYPWMHLESSGVEIRFAESKGGFIDEDALMSLSDGRTRVICISWVQFNNGYRVDVGKLGEFCRENGIIFCVDGIQGAGVIPVDVTSAHIDLFSCGCQKWMLGPCGTAFFYMSERAEEKIEPPLLGWLSVDWGGEFTDLLRYRLAPRTGPSKYELGTYPFQDIFALEASLDLLQSFDRQAAWDHIRSLGDMIVAAIDSHSAYELMSSRDESRRSGIVAIRAADSRKLLSYLTDNGFVVSLREGCVRVSPHFYNGPDEIESFVESLKRFND
jgi:cysteine desulfurase/selenocysteine lyase